MNILKNILHPFKINDKLIRLGAKADGGYVINEQTINNIKYCYTYGVGSEINFENDMLDINPSIIVNLYDHTVEKPELKPNMTFFKKGLAGHQNGELDSFFNHLKANGQTDEDRILLKIDAEGAEYPLFNENSIEMFKNIDAMIIEFHYIEQQLENFIKIINNINKYFHIIHIHGNNHSYGVNYQDFIFPSVPEISFVNKKNYNLIEKVDNNYPIKELDYPANPTLEDIEIKFN